MEYFNTEHEWLSPYKKFPFKLEGKIYQSLHEYLVQSWSGECMLDLQINAGIREQLSQNPKLKEHLLSTGNVKLVYASHDTVLGIGMSRHDDDAKSPWLWKGKNMLGDEFTRVRTMLRKMDEDEKTKVEAKVLDELYKRIRRTVDDEDKEKKRLSELMERVEGCRYPFRNSG